MESNRRVFVAPRATRGLLLLVSLAGCQGVTDPSGSFAGASIAFDQLGGGRVLLVANLESYLFDGAARTVVRSPVHAEWFPAYLALSPDGTRIAHTLVELTSVNSANYTTVVVNLNGANSRELRGGFRGPAWSPDGSAVYYAGASTVYRQSLSGDELPQPVQSAPATLACSWPASVSTSGQIALDCKQSIVVLTPPATTRVMADLATPVGLSADAWPQWSPDGSRLAYVARTHSAYRVLVLEAASGQFVVSIETQQTLGQPFCWSRSGDRILVIRSGVGDPGGSLYAVSVASGQAVRVVSNPGSNFSMNGLSCSR